MIRIMYNYYAHIIRLREGAKGIDNGHTVSIRWYDVMTGTTQVQA